MRAIALCLVMALVGPVAHAASDHSACSSQTGRDKLRCESRHKRLLRQGTKSRIVRSRAQQDSSAFGRTKLRFEERMKRSAANKKRLSRRGPTVRELPKVKDVNTSRIQYLQEYRQNQVQCMEEAPGRPRRLCFERIRNGAKKAMKDARGTWLENRK